MKTIIKNNVDPWQEIKDATMNTIGKNTGSYPTSEWKRQLLLFEHSPIRKLKLSWKWIDIKYWVSVHFIRHKFGIEHFVKTQRTDRTGVNREMLPQSTLVNHECEANAQAIINISRKRLCNSASTETRQTWIEFKHKLEQHEPELASVMRRECVYRGFCPEMFPCGYSESIAFTQEVQEYRYGKGGK